MSKMKSLLQVRKLTITIGLYILIVINISQNGLNAQSSPYDAAIIDAYEMRMEGRLDESRTILTGVLDKDSLDAMANFEMARFIQSTEMFNTADMLKFSNRASELDSNNVQFLFYNANIKFLNAYIAMHRGDQENINRFVIESSMTYESVLKLRPDCIEAMLYLIDMHSNLSEDSGGDLEKAQQHLEVLNKIDSQAGAMGILMMSEDSVNAVQYWNNYIDDHGSNIEIQELLAKEYLMEGKTDEAEKIFNEMVLSDPSKTYLLLHLGRAHLMRVMQNKEVAQTELPQVKKYMLMYLDSDVEKPVAIESWSYGQLSRVEKFMENEDQSAAYHKKAKALNPSFSRAFAIPRVDDPPNTLKFSYESFFKPFRKHPLDC